MALVFGFHQCGLAADTGVETGQIYLQPPTVNISSVIRQRR